MKLIEGFYEDCGHGVERKKYTEDILEKISKKYSYSEIVLPTVEDAASYSEEIVGKSPWPEWNKKGCFFFEIDNFIDSYDKKKTQKVLLIPEGTVSVTRWLANRMERGMVFFPIRIFYSLECYRNELLSTLTNEKRREFHQFGLEILGTDNIQSDVEILNIISEMLFECGIPKKNIRIRLNDVRILLYLAQKSYICEEDILILKELFDEIAEAKAGKHSETLSGDIHRVEEVLGRYIISDPLMTQWRAIIYTENYDLSKLLQIADLEIVKMFETLFTIQNSFAVYDINVVIDPCVIRSHEYYTSISFEVDVLSERRSYIEIAGGGRYDRLVGRFLTNSTQEKVCSTGFAFGTERLIKVLEDMGCYCGEKTVEKKYILEEQDSVIIAPRDKSPEAYLKAVKQASQNSFVVKFVE